MSRSEVFNATYNIVLRRSRLSLAFYNIIIYIYTVNAHQQTRRTAGHQSNLTQNGCYSRIDAYSAVMARILYPRRESPNAFYTLNASQLLWGGRKHLIVYTLFILYIYTHLSLLQTHLLHIVRAFTHGGRSVERRRENLFFFKFLFPLYTILTKIIISRTVRML